MAIQQGLSIVAPDERFPALALVADQATEYLNQAKAANTIRAYRADWKHFVGWSKRHGQSYLPATPDSVCLYLSDLARACKPATLSRRMAAISQAHQIAGFDSPTRSSKVRLVMSGIRRTKGTSQTGKNPIVVEDLRRLVSRTPEAIIGVRDRALLLVGFAGAFRRSELVALNRSDADFTRDGLVILLRRSKTDQEGSGRKVGIPYGSNPATCPVRSLQAWLEASQINEGPLFRPINRHSSVATKRLSGAAVAGIVKKYVSSLAMDPTHYAGHSLRSGLVTSCAAAGVSERSIMNQTGHRSLTTVRRYIRDGNLFRENAAAVIGL